MANEEKNWLIYFKKFCGPLKVYKNYKKVYKNNHFVAIFFTLLDSRIKDC